MKKYISIVCIIFFNALLAQDKGVGINTSDPKETLHILSNKEYILGVNDGNTYDGNYTITSADNKGTFKIEKTDSFRSLKLIQTHAGQRNYDISIDEFEDWIATGHTFSLAPGRWSINITSLLSYDNTIGLKDANGISLYNTPIVIVEATIGEGSISEFNISGDLEGNQPGSIGGKGIVRGSIVSPLENGMLKGVIVLNNLTPSNKAYRILIRNKVTNLEPLDLVIKDKKIQNFLRRGEPQTQLYAVPLN